MVYITDKIRIIKIDANNFESQKETLEQAVSLSSEITSKMNQGAQKAQFFHSDLSDVMPYVMNPQNTVVVALQDENVVGGAYIVSGHEPYSYNDLTKYVKTPENPAYIDFLKQKYGDNLSIAADEAFTVKCIAISSLNANLIGDAYQEILEGRFDEKSKSRATITRAILKAYGAFRQTGGTKFDLADFLYFKQKDRSMYSLVTDRIANSIAPDINYNLTNSEKYIGATPNNTIELDTVFVKDNARSGALAKTLLYEGICHNLQTNTLLSSEKTIYLSMTNHQDNFSSRSLAEFFGLADVGSVKRRAGVDRQVRFIAIKRNEMGKYLTSIQEKLGVLYGYKNFYVPPKRAMQIIRQERKTLKARKKILKLGGSLDKSYYKKCLDYADKKDIELKNMMR
ncbi:hypothetical protein [Treponema sp. R6D11]